MRQPNPRLCQPATLASDSMTTLTLQSVRRRLQIRDALRYRDDTNLRCPSPDNTTFDNISAIIWMSFEFSYSRLDRNVWERVPRSTENQRVFVHESCSNFFLSSSAFALKESSSAGVKNRISGRITSSAFDDSLTVESITGQTYASNPLATRFLLRAIFFWRLSYAGVSQRPRFFCLCRLCRYPGAAGEL